MIQTGTRDIGMGALILGFFASAWFSWGLADPPASWTTWMNVGSYVALGVAVIGAIFAWRHWSGGSGLRDQQGMRRYSIIVGIECVAAFVGAITLALTGQSEFIAVWIALVVGAHFIPMAPVFVGMNLIPLGIGLIVAAFTGLIVAPASDIEPSALTGAISGCVLLIGSALMLVRYTLGSRGGTPSVARPTKEGGSSRNEREGS